MDTSRPKKLVMKLYNWQATMIDLQREIIEYSKFVLQLVVYQVFHVSGLRLMYEWRNTDLEKLFRVSIFEGKLIVAFTGLFFKYCSSFIKKKAQNHVISPFTAPIRNKKKSTQKLFLQKPTRLSQLSLFYFLIR